MSGDRWCKKCHHLPFLICVTAKAAKKAFRSRDITVTLLLGSFYRMNRPKEWSRVEETIASRALKNCAEMGRKTPEGLPLFTALTAGSASQSIIRTFVAQI
jgi:hypothetical protein